VKQDQEDEPERDEQLHDGDNSGQQLKNPFSLARLPTNRSAASMPVSRRYCKN
jgi:hypothetical protein